MSSDRPPLVDAFRSRWAYSTTLMALTMLMPVLGIFSRAQERAPDADLWVWIVASVLPGLVGLGFFAGAVWIAQRFMNRRTATLSVLLWTVTGVVVGIAAIVIREFIPGSTASVPLNSVLIVTVTIGTMALLVFGRHRLHTYEEQLLVARAQNRRLEQAQEEERASAVAQVTALGHEIERVLSPEIQLIETQVASLGDQSTSRDVRHVLEDVQKYTAAAVRTASHDLAEDTQREVPDESASTASGALRWRGVGGIWDLLLSSHLTAGVVLIGGVYFLGRYAEPGCAAALSMGVAGYLAVGLVVATIGRVAPLRRRPWALVTLLVGTIGGFTVMQLLLARDPACVPTYPMASQIIDVTVSLTVLLGLMVLFEAGRRARATTEIIQDANASLVAQTTRLQQSSAVTRSRMAQILHGGVQGRLSSISLAIRRYLDAAQAGREPSLTDLKRRVGFLLEEVRTEIGMLSSPTGSTGTDLMAYLHHAVRQWRGLLAIEFTVEAEALQRLAASPHGSLAVQEVIDAAITNANQHGEATHVWISITLEQIAGRQAFGVTVDDDGVGPPSRLAVGLGLSGIDAWGGTWTLERRKGGGSRLAAALLLG